MNNRILIYYKTAIRVQLLQLACNIIIVAVMTALKTAVVRDFVRAMYRRETNNNKILLL